MIHYVSADERAAYSSSKVDTIQSTYLLQINVMTHLESFIHCVNSKKSPKSSKVKQENCRTIDNVVSGKQGEEGVMVVILVATGQATNCLDEGFFLELAVASFLFFDPILNILDSFWCKESLLLETHVLTLGLGFTRA
jgi:hypothetical protein